MSQNNHNACFMSLFAGCGGLSLGLMQAGWKGLLAVEKDKFAFQTLKKNLVDGPAELRFNWPDWFPKEPCNIKSFISRYQSNLRDLRGKVELVAGGPPCQGFSLAGKRDKNDPRNKLFRHYVEIVKIVEPTFILLENVEGITKNFLGKRKGKQSLGTRKPFSERIISALDSDYLIFKDIIRAVEYGIPQYRPRYVMIGINKKYYKEKVVDINPFEFLRNNRARFLINKGLTGNPVTVRDAISDLETRGKHLVNCFDSPRFKQIAYEKPITNYQSLLHGKMNGKSPNSLRLANHREETLKRFAVIQKTCRHGIGLSNTDRERLGMKKHTLVLLAPDKPSHTLTTLPDDLLHYSEPRILTVREYARLQSFPDWYEFLGNYTTGGKRRVKECPRYTQVGNAVPPLLAEAIGLVLCEFYRGRHKDTGTGGKKKKHATK